MSSLTCRELIEFLDDYVAGDVSPDRRAEFESHLAVCRACRDYLAEYRTSIALVRSLRETPATRAADAKVPEGLVRAILAATQIR